MRSALAAIAAIAAIFNPVLSFKVAASRENRSVEMIRRRALIIAKTRTRPHKLNVLSARQVDLSVNYVDTTAGLKKYEHSKYKLKKCSSRDFVCFLCSLYNFAKH